MTKLVKLQPSDSALDLACGYGNTAITAQMMGEKVTGIDITPELLELAKEEEKIPELVELTGKSLNFRIQYLK